MSPSRFGDFRYLRDWGGRIIGESDSDSDWYRAVVGVPHPSAKRKSVVSTVSMVSMVSCVVLRVEAERCETVGWGSCERGCSGWHGGRSIVEWAVTTLVFRVGSAAKGGFCCRLVFRGICCRWLVSAVFVVALWMDVVAGAVEAVLLMSCVVVLGGAGDRRCSGTSRRYLRVSSGGCTFGWVGRGASGESGRAKKSCRGAVESLLPGCTD